MVSVPDVLPGKNENPSKLPSSNVALYTWFVSIIKVDIPRFPAPDALLTVQLCEAVVPQGMDNTMLSELYEPEGAEPMVDVAVVVSEVEQLDSMSVTVFVPEVVYA